METVVGIVVIIAGLVAMQAYLQRAMQGGLFAASQSFGTQFDPRDTWDERPSINIKETIAHQSAGGMVEAKLIETTPYSDFQLYMLESRYGIRVDPDWYLSSLPTGHVPREPAGFVGSRVTSEWTTGGNLIHDDQR